MDCRCIIFWEKDEEKEGLSPKDAQYSKKADVLYNII